MRCSHAVTAAVRLVEPVALRPPRQHRQLGLPAVAHSLRRSRLPLHAAKRQLCCVARAVAGPAAPPAPPPPGTAAGDGLLACEQQQADNEMQQLCMELATAVTLPPADEVALLGPPPPGAKGLPRSPEQQQLDAELRQLCVELATVATLPPAEEAALLGPPVLDPALLPQPLLVLRCRPEGHPEASETVYYILGTAHISQQSCADVAELIRAVQPQFVFLELCKERAAMLAEGVQYRQPNLAEAAQLVRSGRATPFSIVYSWLLSKVGRGMELEAGGEFKVALQEAKACGAKYVLGDRPISITMARMWAALSGWEKARLLGSLLWMGSSKVDKEAMKREVEGLKQGNALAQAVAEFGKEFPSVLKPLVDERDLYMVYVLRKLALYGDRVVAVVGAGHHAGIRAHWEDEIDLEELTRLPNK